MPSSVRPFSSLFLAAAIYVLLLSASNTVALQCYTCQTRNVIIPDTGFFSIDNTNVTDCPSDGVFNKVPIKKCETSSARCAKFQYEKDKAVEVFRGCVDSAFCASAAISEKASATYVCTTCGRNKCNNAPSINFAITSNLLTFTLVGIITFN